MRPRVAGALGVLALAVGVACTGYIPTRTAVGGTEALYNPPEELPPILEEDSIAVIRRVNNVLFLHYEFLRRGGPSVECRAEKGEFCLRGDWDTAPCPRPSVSSAFCSNHEQEYADRDTLVAVLDSAVAVLPGDPWVLGQQVYARTKFRLYGPAQFALQRCPGEPWYCAGLRGWFYDQTDQPVLADSAFRFMSETMPEKQRCEWADLADLYRWRIGGEYRGLSCEEREALNERIWWLADPLLLVDGNERRTEHYSRHFGAVLHNELLEAGGGYHPRSHHRRVIPHGFEDSICTSGAIYPSSRYSFLPDWEAVRDPLGSRPEAWRLMRTNYNDRVEGYTPPFAFFYTELDAQVGYFRRGSEARVLIASEVGLNENLAALEYGAGVWIGTGPDSVAARLFDATYQRRYAFFADVDAAPHLFSVEAFATGRGAGRARFGQGPPFTAEDDRGISDLLLFRPSGPPPNSLEDVAGLAYGRSYVSSAEPLGLFWELYGAERDEMVSYVLIVDRPGSGFLGIGGFEPIRIDWTAPARPNEEGRWVNVQDIEIRDLSPGRYTLQLTASIGGLVPFTVTRAFDVIDPPPIDLLWPERDPMIGTMGSREDLESLPCRYMGDSPPWIP